jgi:MYXO-CTERM domain-containing protein
MVSTLAVLSVRLRCAAARSLPQEKDKMLHFMRSRGFAFGALLACGLAAAPAGASVVLFAGDMANSAEGFCDFDGKVEYDFLGGTAGKITFTLTNTTDADIGGYLTGFVFNIDGHNVDLNLTTETHPFDQLDNESAPPFGTYRAGAALGGDWTGGGSPKKGIKVGDTGVFAFDLDSVDANIINAATFLMGENKFNFVARFRGLANGGSDKVPGGDIPAPGSLALLGLAGLTAARRRRA